MKSFILAAVFAACSILAVTAADPLWSQFRGSFLILKDESFAPFPRTIREPLFTQENWVPTSSSNSTNASDCTNGGKFNGVQYVKNNDYSVGLLYDVNGIIAGIQMLIPQTTVRTANNTLKYDAVPMYNTATYNNSDYYVLTMYFVDPSIICTVGRNETDLENEGTGTGLFMQNGPTPASVLELPMDRPEGAAANSTGWTENNCFPAMGSHNFYRVPNYTPTNCTEMDPIFGLYNRDKKLHGFGFITPGNIDNPRFEHPPPAAIKMILGDTPQCVLDVQASIGVTSLHVYFIPRPQSVVEGLDPKQMKECLKLSKRHLKSMMKSFKACNDKLGYHLVSREEYQKKIGCVVKCAMQSVNVLDENDIMTEAKLKTAIESQIPPEYVDFAHQSLAKCIKEHTLDPKDENCKSYLDMGTCMQGATAEMCGDLPMI